MDPRAERRQGAAIRVLAREGTQVDEMDENGDGEISPVEFYNHCRKQLAANQPTFEEALRVHQVLRVALLR